MIDVWIKKMPDGDEVVYGKDAVSVLVIKDTDATRHFGLTEEQLKSLERQIDKQIRIARKDK